MNGGLMRGRVIGLILLALTGYIACFWPADTSFLSYSLAGATAIHLWARPPKGELLGALLWALAFVAVYLACQGPPPWIPPLPGFYIGLGSLAAVGWRSVRTGQAPWYAFPVLLLPLTLIVTVLASPVWAAPTRPVADWVTLKFDDRLGGQPSFVLGRFFAMHRWVNALHREAYDGLPLVIALLYAAHMRAPSALERQRLVLMLLVTPVICAFIYQVFPVVGPKFAFPSFYPAHVPAFPLVPFPRIPVSPEVQRNGLPSMHLGWAMFVWWGLRRQSSTWGWLGTVFLVLTVIATLGLGQHYLVDLVVAVPFACAVEAAFRIGRPWRGPRGAAVVLGVALTCAWVVALLHEDWWVGAGVSSCVAAAALTVVGPILLVESIQVDKSYGQLRSETEATVESRTS
jgi:hypothetical protein